MRKFVIIFLLFAAAGFLAAPPVFGGNQTDFKKLIEHKVVLKTNIAGVKITLLSEKIGGKEIKTQELDYFKKLVFASVKYFPKFREERFPKNRPLKKRDGEELAIIVIGGGKTKLLVALAAGYPASSYDSFDGIFLNEDYAKEKTIILCSDSTRFYNFIISGSTVIHEFFHYQVDLYGEFMARELEEQLAKEFETYVFFELK